MTYSRREQEAIDAEHRRRFLVEQQMRQPGGRALLLRDRFLAERARVLVAVEQATDPAEKKRLTAQADEFQRMADEQAGEARSSTMKKAADEIRKRMSKALADVASRYALVNPEDDEQYPPDYRLKRELTRADLLREWRTIESTALGELNAWAQEAGQAAEALYLSDPVGDAAAESRRVSERLEAQELATPFVGQSPTMVRNRLLPHVQRFIATGNLDRARVFMSAAKIAGVEDGRLEQALTEAEDASIPHRKLAREQQRAIADETDVLRAEMYGARIIHGIGSRDELNQAATMSKMLAWRQANGLYPVPGTSGNGAGGGATSGEGAASGVGATGGTSAE